MLFSRMFFLAERYFAECLVNPTLFSRIIVQQNVISPNRYWAVIYPKSFSCYIAYAVRMINVFSDNCA